MPSVVVIVGANPDIIESELAPAKSFNLARIRSRRDPSGDVWLAGFIEDLHLIE